MNPIESFAKNLIDNAESISREIVEYNLSKLDIELPQELIDISIETNRDFFILLGKSFSSSDDTAVAEFLDWHKKQVAQQAETNITFKDISSIVRPYADTRLRLIEMVTKISIKEGLLIEEAVFVNSRISYMLDLAITETIIERERLAIENQYKNQQIITELSSPIVPITNGMAILPLIGEFDLERSDYVMTNVIPKVSEMKIERLIIDFSGMATFDSEVASRIFNIYDVLGLLGIEGMFTGMRPDLVTKIVSAGVDFSKVKTFGTVQHAILSLT